MVNKLLLESDKMKFDLTDEQFKEAAKSMSAMTALVEAADWDEDRAYEIFDSAFAALTTLYEYSLHDSTLITGEAEYRELLRVNMALEVSEAEFDAVMDLMDGELGRRLSRVSTLL